MHEKPTKNYEKKDNNTDYAREQKKKKVKKRKIVEFFADGQFIYVYVYSCADIDLIRYTRGVW